MFLSVIIPTRNRLDLLEKALESILSQTYPMSLWEIIIVDNGSTDATRSVAEIFKNKLPNLQYIYDDRPGLHIGRHAGLNVATGDILVYADDDIEAMPTWLEAIATSFTDDQIVLVGGKNLPKFESPPPEWLLKLWKAPHPEGNVLAKLSILDLGDHVKKINPFFVYGCNFSIRKRILLAAGGFHPDGMPEDLLRFRGDGESHVSSYIFKNDYKTLYHPKAFVYHFVPESRMTEKYFFNRSFKQGISDSYTAIRSSHLTPKTVSFEKKAINTAKSFLSFFTNKKHNVSKFENMMKEYYNKGYIYHQSETNRDRSLLEWVLKDNYFI